MFLVHDYLWLFWIWSQSTVDNGGSKCSAVANFAAISVSNRIYLKTFDLKSGEESADF